MKMGAKLERQHVSTLVSLLFCSFRASVPSSIYTFLMSVPHGVFPSLLFTDGKIRVNRVDPVKALH